MNRYIRPGAREPKFAPGRAHHSPFTPELLLLNTLFLTFDKALRPYVVQR
jgi:hypothetical protein